MIRYEHTQQAKALRASLLGGALGAVLFPWVAPVPAAPLVPVVAVLIGCAIVFSSLTIRVTDRALAWHFGPGLFRKSVPLEAIAAVERTRTRWIEGWGIHRTRRGWLYNVAGCEAVLVTRKNGKAFLLGTDEPERLRLAILQAGTTMGHELPRAKPTER